MLKSKGFSAWICVNGQAVETYGQQVTTDGRTVTGWVASQAGQQFSVHWRDSVRITTTDGQVEVDGVKCGGGVIRARTSGNTQDEAKKNGLRISLTMKKPFMWAALELTEDDTYLNNASSNIGEIHLNIYQFHLTGSRGNKLGSWHGESKDLALRGQQRIHERAKKCQAHCVTTGEVVKKPCTIIDGKQGELFATFIFRYKPLDFLIADDIAPRPPNRLSSVGSPAINNNPAGKKRARTESSSAEDEIEALEARLEELRAKRDQELRVKTEDGHVPQKRMKFEEGEIIDLT